MSISTFFIIDTQGQIIRELATTTVTTEPRIPAKRYDYVAEGDVHDRRESVYYFLRCGATATGGVRLALRKESMRCGAVRCGAGGHNDI